MASIDKPTRPPGRFRRFQCSGGDCDPGRYPDTGARLRVISFHDVMLAVSQKKPGEHVVFHHDLHGGETWG